MPRHGDDELSSISKTTPRLFDFVRDLDCSHHFEAFFKGHPIVEYRGKLVPACYNEIHAPCAPRSHQPVPYAADTLEPTNWLLLRCYVTKPPTENVYME